MTRNKRALFVALFVAALGPACSAPAKTLSGAQASTLGIPDPPSPATMGGVTATTISAVNQLPQSPPAPGEFRVHNIDVGTGLSVLVQGTDFTLLFDGGSMDDRDVISRSGNKDRLLAYLFAAVGPSGPAECTPGATIGNRRIDPAWPSITSSLVTLTMTTSPC